MTRFLVRASYSEYGPELWRLWDAVDRRWLETFAHREAAEAEAALLERGWRARLSIVKGEAS